MLKSYKTEIDPTPEQKIKIKKTIGVSRYIYNFYIAHNKELYEDGEKFMTAYDFNKWLNNEYIPNNPDKIWIKEVSTKAITKSLLDANTAYKRFFDKKANFPRFKKKNKNEAKMYFVKTDKKAIIQCERHRIKIPTLGWVKIKEKGYIPTTKSGKIIKSGTVSIKAGRYYVSVLVEESETRQPDLNLELNPVGLGIDLGLKDFAIVSNGKTYKNINKTKKIKNLEKKLKREQRSLSRKYEDLKKRNKINKEGEEATRQNIQKQVLKIQKLYKTLTNIRTDYLNKPISEIVKTKPSYITIEDLNVSGMMKNRHLSKAIASQKFYEFRTKLIAKSKELGIEVRIVDRFYPSSKLCHNCGNIKKDLKLSDREYICECGYKADRDYNASLNLRDAKVYTIA